MAWATNQFTPSVLTSTLYPAMEYPPVDVGVPQLTSRAFGVEELDVMVSDVGADAVETGMADVIAPPDVSTVVTVETLNQYDVPLASPVTLNDVVFGSDNDDATFNDVNDDPVPYSTL